MPAESKPNLAMIEAVLLAEAPKQWERFQKNKMKRDRGKVKWQRELEEIDRKMVNAEAKDEEIRRQYDPELMRINANLERKLGTPTGLCCLKCGEPDRGNKMNGKPWCMKCNLPLESHSSANKSVPILKSLPTMKRLNVTFRELDK